MKKIKKKVIWFTGLSGSGKSTLAKNLFEYLTKKDYRCIILDGDEVRSGLCRDLNFNENNRLENIRRIAEISTLLIQQVDFVIVATISPSDLLRNLARKIIGNKFFTLIYLSASLNACFKRDPKGLYKKASEGKIKDFTGVGSNFEIPKKWDLELNTSKITIPNSLKKIINIIEM